MRSKKLRLPVLAVVLISEPYSRKDRINEKGNFPVLFEMLVLSKTRWCISKTSYIIISAFCTQYRTSIMQKYI